MDSAYAGNETIQLALVHPRCPAAQDPAGSLEYDRQMYKRRNEVERLFRRLKGFRCMFSRFDKLDAVFIGFIGFSLIVDGLRLFNTP